MGSAIGMKVMEQVPYIVGLDKFLGSELTDDVISYLKDFGAATASNGAVGLYHIENLTPEAKKLKQKLLKDKVKKYVIDDKELERVYKSYPVMWKNKDAKPTLCFIGCPHLSFNQLIDWTKKLQQNLKEAKRKKVCVRTIMTAAPDVVEKFKQTQEYALLIKTGVKLSSNLPVDVHQQPNCGWQTNNHKPATNLELIQSRDITKMTKLQKLFVG